MLRDRPVIVVKSKGLRGGSRTQNLRLRRPSLETTALRAPSKLRQFWRRQQHVFFGASECGARPLRPGQSAIHQHSVQDARLAIATTIVIAKINFRNEIDGRRRTNSPHPSLSPHPMRGEGGFSRVRGVRAHDDDRKLLLATTLKLLCTKGESGKVRANKRKRLCLDLRASWHPGSRRCFAADILERGAAETQRRGRRNGP